jgi:protease secretion system membrane fusion protein
MRLDDANARANYESTRQHYLGLRAMEGRLVAEQSGAAKIIFHPDLLEKVSDPLIGQHIANQQHIFNSRRQTLQSEVQGIEESIQGLEGSLQGYNGMLQSRRSQQTMLQEELKGIRDMVQEGYAPRTRQWELERMAAESNGSIADLQGNIIRAQRSVAELKMRAIQRRQEYRKEVDTLLADVRREVQADAEKSKAASQELERTEIRAPAAGQVVGMMVQSVGAVIQPSQKLMDIVPEDQQLLLETRVPPHLIDRVTTGMITDVRFSGFAHTPQLVVQGKIVSISGDILAEPQQPPYFLARVAITPDGMKKLGKHELQPGMPVEVIIKTGERSLLTYLLHPLTKRMAASMKEE